MHICLHVNSASLNPEVVLNFTSSKNMHDVQPTKVTQNVATYNEILSQSKTRHTIFSAIKLKCVCAVKCDRNNCVFQVQRFHILT